MTVPKTTESLTERKNTEAEQKLILDLRQLITSLAKAQEVAASRYLLTVQ